MARKKHKPNVYTTQKGMRVEENTNAKHWAASCEYRGEVVVLRARAKGAVTYKDDSGSYRSTGASTVAEALEWAFDLLEERVKQAVNDPQESVEAFKTTWRKVLYEYRRIKFPRLSKKRQAAMRRHLAMLEAILDGGYVEDHDLDTPIRWADPNFVEAVTDARLEGGFLYKAGARGKLRKAEEVDINTVCGFWRAIMAILNWASYAKVKGDDLIVKNPIAKAWLPDEHDKNQPAATGHRYRHVMDFALTADPEGRLRCILAIVRWLGWRLSMVRKLRRRDVALTMKEVEALLTEATCSTNKREHARWFFEGGIRMPAMKQEKTYRDDDRDPQYDRVVAITPELRPELEYYLANHFDGDEDDYLFPLDTDASRPIGHTRISEMYARAEELAREDGRDIPNLEGGRFHPYRRLRRAEANQAGIDRKIVAFGMGWSTKAWQTMDDGYLPLEGWEIPQGTWCTTKGFERPEAEVAELPTLPDGSKPVRASEYSDGRKLRAVS